MRITDVPCHLTYCLNVHSGETWPECLSAIKDYTLAIKNTLLPNDKFGLGLRLSARAADELAEPTALSNFRTFMHNEDLYTFTVNGFPYGTFHGTSVKSDVYRPDWRTPDRKDYTLRLATILNSLLPTDAYGSISTVPVSYRPWINTDEDINMAVENLVETVAELASMLDKGGSDIILALEPEPDCFLENTDDCISFFNNNLFTRGSAYLANARGITKEQAKAQIQHHVGICLDTCHLALQFEDPEESLKRLVDAGINVPKVQVSSALSARVTNQASLKGLEQFCDPVYLHQVAVREESGNITRFDDLEHALTAQHAPLGEWRVHCHVPLDFTGSGNLSTTALYINNNFFLTAQDAGVRHFEIETYTFDVLPQELQRDGIVPSIIREYKWVRERLR